MDEVVAARAGIEQVVEVADVAAHHLDAEPVEEIPVVVPRGLGLVAGADQLGLGHVVVGDDVPALGQEDLAYVGSEEPTASCDQDLQAA